MHITVEVIEITSFCQDISHKTQLKKINDSISVIISCYVRYLLAENKLGKVKLTTLIFVICNISAMCTEMTKTYDIMICLRQLLCMCKAEKTQLNDRVAIWGFCVQRTVVDKVQTIGSWQCLIQSIQTSLEILCREP